jgi:hypothetical protein
MEFVKYYGLVAFLGFSPLALAEEVCQKNISFGGQTICADGAIIEDKENPAGGEIIEKFTTIVTYQREQTQKTNSEEQLQRRLVNIIKLNEDIIRPALEAQLASDATCDVPLISDLAVNTDGEHEVLKCEFVPADSVSKLLKMTLHRDEEQVAELYFEIKRTDNHLFHLIENPYKNPAIHNLLEVNKAIQSQQQP